MVEAMIHLHTQDCLAFIQAVQEETYDLIVADPPYFDTVDEQWDTQWKDDSDYLCWIKKIIEGFARVLSKNGNLILYCKRQLLPQIRLLCDNVLKEQRTIVWVRRRNADVTRGKTLASGYEPILWYSKSESYVFNADQAKISPAYHLLHRKEYQEGGRLENGVGLTDAWIDIPALPHNAAEKTEHPTQKPLLLAERIVALFSAKGQRVYIPFAGSGTEIIACRNLSRQWDATEVNPTYIDIIHKRMSSQFIKLDHYFSSQRNNND